jgi:hypothetical protein
VEPEESSDEDVPLAVRRSQLLRNKSLRQSDLQQRPRTSAAATPFHGHHGNQLQRPPSRNPPARPVSAHFPSQQGEGQNRRVSDSTHRLPLLQRQGTWQSTSTDALLLSSHNRGAEFSSGSGSGVGQGAVLAADARAVANRLYSGAAGAAPGAAEERAARLATWRRSLRREEEAKRVAGPLGSTAAAALNASTASLGNGTAYFGAMMDARQSREMLLKQQQQQQKQQQQSARPQTSGADDVARHVRSMRDLQAQVRHP